jgi:menaquinone-dependent protoporphyrinogen IX oxidase
MQERILVAYASRYGTAAKITKTIAATLLKERSGADVQSIADDLDANPHTAVIFSGISYCSQWPN